MNSDTGERRVQSVSVTAHTVTGRMAADGEGLVGPPGSDDDLWRCVNRGSV